MNTIKVVYHDPSRWFKDTHPHVRSSTQATQRRGKTGERLATYFSQSLRRRSPVALSSPFSFTSKLLVPVLAKNCVTLCIYNTNIIVRTKKKIRTIVSTINSVHCYQFQIKYSAKQRCTIDSPIFETLPNKHGQHGQGKSSRR